MDTMILHIKPTEEKEQEVKELYQNHGTFHEGDVGLDLFLLDDHVIHPSTFGYEIRLGVHCEAFKEVRKGKYGRFENVAYMLVPRSSISKTSLVMANSVGIIDAGYRGEIIAKVHNVSKTSLCKLSRGERLFQIVGSPLGKIEFRIVSSLSETTRGTGGFGSTNTQSDNNSGHKNLEGEEKKKPGFFHRKLW